jgi:hypothetical protein
MTPRTVEPPDKRDPFKLVLASIDLRQWDRDARGDLVAVYIWNNVRPLRGAAGLIDWRLSGKLSSLIQSGRLTGADGEQLLLPTGGRLPWSVAMVMGLGARAGFSATRFRAAVRRFVSTTRGLDVHDVALAPPGRDVNVLPSRRAVELLLDEIGGEANRSWLRRLTVLEAAADHKELSDLIPTEVHGGKQHGR